MNMVETGIWFAILGACAIVAAIVSYVFLGGNFLILFGAGFIGGMAGGVLLEFAAIEISTGNYYVDQALIAIIGAVLFAIGVQFLGLE